MDIIQYNAMRKFVGVLDNPPDHHVSAAVEGRKMPSPERLENSVHLDLPF